MTDRELLDYITQQFHYKVDKIDEQYAVMDGDEFYGYKVVRNYSDGSGAPYIFDSELAAWKQIIDLVRIELEGC